MKLKLKILNLFSRKTLGIVLMLLVGIGFSAGGVMADNCQGGIGCLNCAAEAHPHMPGMDAATGNDSCQPDGQNRSCGFEVGQRADEFDSIASMAGFGNYQHAGIFFVASDKFDPTLLPEVLISQLQYPDTGGSTPIFLLNRSLLC